MEETRDGLHETDVLIERAVLVGVELQTDRHFPYSMEELGNLAEALGIEVLGEVVQSLDRPHPAHYVGSGKLEEIRRFAEQVGANLVLFNDELSPSQIRNIEADLECKILDRTMLILDIFARRARTREAQMQVELAQLQYMLPRLVGMRASLSRQGGGDGGFRNRGAGETKLELDRRKIEDQIARLKRELTAMEDQRETQRRQRKRAGLPVVSIVGYTNAGKSTLLNRILEYVGAGDDKRVTEKDMLFATLETSVRQVPLSRNRTFLLTDTVGFVSRLPTHLIKAFRSTLEEARDADLLLHVIDVSDPEYRFRIDVTQTTLLEIGVEGVEALEVFNKADLSDIAYPERAGRQIWLSAKDGNGISELLEMIAERIFADRTLLHLLIPFDRGELVSHLQEHADVQSVRYVEGGTYIAASLGEADANRFAPYETTMRPEESAD